MGLWRRSRRQVRELLELGEECELVRGLVQLWRGRQEEEGRRQQQKVLAGEPRGCVGCGEAANLQEYLGEDEYVWLCDCCAEGSMKWLLE